MDPDSVDFREFDDDESVQEYNRGEHTPPSISNFFSNSQKAESEHILTSSDFFNTLQAPSMSENPRSLNNSDREPSE